jgi:hypothetical protein
MSERAVRTIDDAHRLALSLMGVGLTLLVVALVLTGVP